MTNKANLEQLEAIIDSIGLAMTVRAISTICYEKAEHIATNWQDASTGKVWAKGGALLDVTAIKIKNLGV